MRILLDQGTTDMRNKGNNILLEVATHRLRKYWPDASYNVITFAPLLANLYIPGIQPVSPYNLQPVHNWFEKIFPIVPRPIWWALLEVREQVWHRWPGLVPSKIKQTLRNWLSSRTRWRKSNETEIGVNEPRAPFIAQKQPNGQQGMSDYDLYVVTGGGFMCDHAKPYLLNIFSRLETAIMQGIPTVMVGQGIGPIEDPELRARAKEILPFVDLIFVRERRVALPLLDSLGVPKERVIMTGDDAIEPAYNTRTPTRGTGIGVSLRVAPHTQVERQHIEILRRVLHRVARNHQAPLIAVPISPAPHESDITHIRKLLAGYEFSVIGWRKLDTAVETIKKAAHCRVMVTGTFHAAVFALAQGIPVVALAKSVEYHNKLSGLSDEFGPGCQVIRLDDDQLLDHLTAAIENAWSSADQFRSALLEAAVRQIKLQHTAYQRIYELVVSGTREKPVPKADSLVAFG